MVRNLWMVSDRIISGEKMLRDAQDKWSSPPAKPTKSQQDTPGMEYFLYSKNVLRFYYTKSIPLIFFLIAVDEKSDLDDSSGDDVSKENAGNTNKK